MSVDDTPYAQFYQFLEKVGDFVAILKPDGQILQINENGRYLLALFEDDAAQFNIADLIQAGQGKFAAILDTAVSAGSWQGELILANPEGLEIPASVKLVANRPEAGDVDFLASLPMILLNANGLSPRYRKVKFDSMAPSTIHQPGCRFSVWTAVSSKSIHLFVNIPGIVKPNSWK